MGRAQPNLSQTIIKTFSVPVPDFETQQKVVKELDELSLKVSELRKLQESQLSDLKNLEQAYLREAFSGDLI
jgi:restriction endonuclease S subunit